jgi:hypothetical protein
MAQITVELPPRLGQSSPDKQNCRARIDRVMAAPPSLSKEVPAAGLHRYSIEGSSKSTQGRVANALLRAIVLWEAPAARKQGSHTECIRVGPPPRVRAVLRSTRERSGRRTRPRGVVSHCRPEPVRADSTRWHFAYQPEAWTGAALRPPNRALGRSGPATRTHAVPLTPRRALRRARHVPPSAVRVRAAFSNRCVSP